MTFEEGIKEIYSYGEWFNNRTSEQGNPTYRPGSIRIPKPDGFRLVECRAYGVAGSFCNQYVKEDASGQSFELIVAPCADYYSATQMMLQRLSVMQSPHAERYDRWNSDVGFACKGSGGASQMVCRDNLFVSITVWNDNDGTEEEADRVIEEVWNSFM